MEKGRKFELELKKKRLIKNVFFLVEQLEAVCETIEDFKIRKKKIFKHIKE